MDLPRACAAGYCRDRMNKSLVNTELLLGNVPLTNKDRQTCLVRKQKHFCCAIEGMVFENVHQVPCLCQQLL